MKSEDKRLIQAYYSGSITKRDAKKLSELLEHDPKARSYYITYSAITEHLGESIQDTENEIFSSPKLSFPKKQSTAPWLLIAASLVLAFLVFDYLKKRDKDQTVAISEPASVLNNSRNQAQLVDHFNASIKGITRRLEDFIWVPGKYELLSGELHLRFNRSVDFIYQGPGIFEIEDYQNIRVTKGNIRTIVLNENGKGFTIKSPTTTYIDWGTEFTLNISPSQQDKFNIDQGEVEVSSVEKPHNSTMLTRSNLSQQKLDFIELDDRLKPSEPGDAGAKRNFKAFEKLAHHPDTIGLYNFDYPEQSKLSEEMVKRIPKSWQKWSEANDLKPNRLIINHAKSEIGSHGVYHKSHRTRGRWPGSYSIDLPHKGSHVSFSMLGKYPEITINFWLQKLDHLDAINALIRSDHWDEIGNLCIEFDRGGKPYLHQWGETFPNNYRFDNKRLSLGWQLVTYTFGREENDSKSKIYLNGNLVLESKTTWTNHISLSDFTIGGCVHESGPSSTNLNCNIDEMVITKKRWSEEEIREYFLDGFPYYQVEPITFAEKSFSPTNPAR
jgi:hypothetical protein